MNETPFTRQEFEYETIISKQTTLIEHLKKETEVLKSANEISAKELIEQKSANEVMAKEKEILQSANEISGKELETLKGTHELAVKELLEVKAENEKLKADLPEYQVQINDIEAQIDELEKKVISKEDRLLLNGTKADLILAEVFSQQRKFTTEELQQKKFPMVLLESNGKEPSGVTTTNFSLIKTGENEYQLSKN